MTTVEEVPVSKERDRLAADLRPWVERNVVSPNAAYCGRCYDVVLRRFNDSPACQTVIKKLTFMGELSDQPELSCKIDKTGWILSSVVEAALRDAEKQHSACPTLYGLYARYTKDDAYVARELFRIYPLADSADSDQPLVARVKHVGKTCVVQTGRKGRMATRAVLVFENEEDAAEFERVLQAARRPCSRVRSQPAQPAAEGQRPGRRGRVWGQGSHRKSRSDKK
jgi:hypothetical protein